jgi:hypothetical protein
MKKGSKHTKEAIEKDRTANIGRFAGNKNPMFGKGATKGSFKKGCVPWNKKERDETYRERTLVRYKTKDKIPLKSSCQICGSKKNLQRHHWNYSKPNLVNTLCINCHNAQHGFKEVKE